MSAMIYGGYVEQGGVRAEPINASIANVEGFELRCVFARKSSYQLAFISLLYVSYYSLPRSLLLRIDRSTYSRTDPAVNFLRSMKSADMMLHTRIEYFIIYSECVRKY